MSSQLVEAFVVPQVYARASVPNLAVRFIAGSEKYATTEYFEYDPYTKQYTLTNNRFTYPSGLQLDKVWIGIYEDADFGREGPNYIFMSTLQGILENHWMISFTYQGLVFESEVHASGAYKQVVISMDPMTISRAPRELGGCNTGGRSYRKKR